MFQAMSRGNLAKQILDCSWSEWFRQLRYKAEEAGRRLVAVDPKYTSQICSQCGFKHPDNRKTQADFACLSCGYQDMQTTTQPSTYRLGMSR